MRGVLDVSLILLQGAVGIVTLLNAVMSDVEKGRELIRNEPVQARHEDRAVDASGSAGQREIKSRRSGRRSRHESSSLRYKQSHAVLSPDSRVGSATVNSARFIPQGKLEKKVEPYFCLNLTVLALE